jgi:hypothetical protein
MMSLVTAVRSSYFKPYIVSNTISTGLSACLYAACLYNLHRSQCMFVCRLPLQSPQVSVHVCMPFASTECLYILVSAS